MLQIWFYMSHPESFAEMGSYRNQVNKQTRFFAFLWTVSYFFLKKIGKLYGKIQRCIHVKHWNQNVVKFTLKPTVNKCPSHYCLLHNGITSITLELQYITEESILIRSWIWTNRWEIPSILEGHSVQICDLNFYKRFDLLTLISYRALIWIIKFYFY